MFTLDELHEKAERIESGEVVERAYSTPQLAGQKFWSLRVRDSAEGNTSVKWLIHGEAKPSPHIGGEADSALAWSRQWCTATLRFTCLDVRQSKSDHFIRILRVNS